MHIMHVLSAHAHNQCFILGKGRLQHNMSRHEEYVLY